MPSFAALAIIARRVCQCWALAMLLAGSVQAADYAVIVSRATQADPAWREVATALIADRDAVVVEYDGPVDQALPDLRRHFPRYACFVATSGEAGRQFVAEGHRLVRRLDDDPYADLRWGIVTGYDAEAALAIARQREPLVVRRAAAGTEIALDRVVEGLWYCELQQGRSIRKTPGDEPKPQAGPADTTQALADTLTSGQADLFVTSGHATERDWQIGFAYPNGAFRSQAGRLFGVDLAGRRFPIESDHARVYLPVGNCLMGHVDGPDAMALAFMKSAGVRQMVGYTVPTWYGYAGWGCLDYFVEQPGRYTLAEAFLANQHALVERLERYFPELARTETAPGAFPRPLREPGQAARAAGLTLLDGSGLLHDRDVLALYGDPAWDARLAPGPLAFEQSLRELEPGMWEFVVTPRAGESSFDTVNTNGSQRGGRPFVQFLPARVGSAEIVAGQEFSPILTDDFLLVPHPGRCDPARAYRIVFRVEALPSGALGR